VPRKLSKRMFPECVGVTQWAPTNVQCLTCGRYGQRCVSTTTRDGGKGESITDLIKRSSIGEALDDIKARGIDAHLADLERETRRRRKKP
jgi:hypothetical protein